MRTRAFQRGETIPVWAWSKDWDGNYETPTHGVKVTITDPDGVVQVTAQTMTPTAAGKLVYYYLSLVTDTIGWWRTEVKSQDGTGATVKYTISRGGFKLE